MIKIFETPEELSRAAAEIFVKSAKESIGSKGRFLVSLSGGSTPKRVFEILAEDRYSARIDWANIHFFWGDERCVPLNHPDSNAGMTFKALFNKITIPDNNIHVIKGDMPPREAAIEYNGILNSFFVNQNETFDLVFLGMGTDGHTASLFPYTPVLEEKTSSVKEVYLEELGKFRVTITKDVINKSGKVVFLVSGENKAEVLNEVMYGEHNFKKYPSQLIKPLTGELIWFIDESAAKVIKQRQ